MFKRKNKDQLIAEVESIRGDTARNAQELQMVAERQHDIELRLAYLQQELQVQTRIFE
jgi:hypothetical protein